MVQLSFVVDLPVHFDGLPGSHLFDVVPEIKRVGMLENGLVVFDGLRKVHLELLLGLYGIIQPI